MYVRFPPGNHLISELARWSARPEGRVQATVQKQAGGDGVLGLSLRERALAGTQWDSHMWA